MPYLPAYRLKLYRNFKAIDVADFHAIVRFYERNEDAIRTLDFEEYFDCTLAYTSALFESTRYGQHIVMCDHLLQLIINENVDAWGGDALYRRILFSKAASLYHQEELPKSEHILRELLKMEPSDPVCRRFFRKCLLQQKPEWLTKARAAFIVLVLLAVITIAAELFIVRPYYFGYYKQALILHNILLGAGILTLAGGETVHWLACFRRTQQFVQCMARRKKAR
jgi:hypothetical protein